jgi:undecaprenyl-diphosphatase
VTYLEALLYGAVQGITEYLPISSSAHLILLPKFLGTEDPGLTFDVFLHLGTFLATVSYFWRDWLGVLRTLPFVGARVGWIGGGQASVGTGSVADETAGPLGGSSQPTVSWQPIALATVPALIAGALLHDWVETVFRGSEVLVVTLVVGGLVLWASDHFLPRTRELRELTLRDALWVGVAQCCALVPGVSRSGSTITGGRLLGFTRESSARFSFLISAPITGAALAFELRNWSELVNGSVGWDTLLIAFVSSLVFGWLTIDSLLKLLRRFGYLSFAIYRVALALTVYLVFVRG